MAPTRPSEEKAYRKYFIPLESNPEVFTELVHKLGVSESLCYQDVFSLDDPDLLAFIPRPAYALVLVFPTTEAYEARCEQEEARTGPYEGHGESEPVVWYKQTIYNACGLYALLHGISNGAARDHISPRSIMSNVLEAGIPLKPDDRGLVLEDSKELEEAYASVASKGDTQAPADPKDVVDFHYIAYVKASNGHLYQLDGDRRGPIDLGELSSEEDVLSETCLEVIRGLIREDKTGSVNFSLMALVPGND
ncbi:cysteine proteinase [Lophiostoma macrostomum CBS 122681]|uniref:Ubiquitin carboxyl-terminal hydrolase n=1 Tax=Lophiostoma macrostomum CBS 122681 TaxID=1314788 RepID=A0A6A6TUZ3_9PLEO|nr:cysteine proteinase [Lophiostoma macrostomum CBS 122681]